MKPPYDKVRAFMAGNTGRRLTALQVSAGAEILDLKPTREALEQLVREGFISTGQVDGTMCYLHGAPIAAPPARPAPATLNAETIASSPPAAPEENVTMSKTDQIRDVLKKAKAPLIAAEVCQRVGIEDKAFVSTILCQLARKGELLAEGERRQQRYAVNPDYVPGAQQQKRSRKASKATKPAKKPRRQNITIEPAGTIPAAPAVPSAPKVNGYRRDGLLAEERALQDAIDARVTAIAATDPILRALIAEQKRLQQLIEDTRL